MAEGKPVNYGLLDTMIHSGLYLLEKKPDVGQVPLVGEILREVRTRLISDDYAMQALSGGDTSGKESVTVRMERAEEFIDEILGES